MTRLTLSQETALIDCKILSCNRGEHVVGSLFQIEDGKKAQVVFLFKVLFAKSNTFYHTLQLSLHNTQLGAALCSQRILFVVLFSICYV